MTTQTQYRGQEHMPAIHIPLVSQRASAGLQVTVKRGFPRALRIAMLLAVLPRTAHEAALR